MIQRWWRASVTWILILPWNVTPTLQLGSVSHPHSVISYVVNMVELLVQWTRLVACRCVGIERLSLSNDMSNNYCNASYVHED
ncbi:hypothetical protein VN97_g572 [Penicillium thymicola]|uniref:Secreted protein n=1 Tax=Penicillium thymicola TaxID=293382 RepID=A0AAI9TT38_PENTH|nr:hypothetical protein VN97_g572 [Penicillium thymicola]